MADPEPGSGNLVVSGSGSVAVSTDAMIAESERLQALATAMPLAQLALRSAAAAAQPHDAVVLGSWRAREAGAAIEIACTQLGRAVEQCAAIATALEVAALEYGRAELEATARFIDLTEQVAERSGSVVGAIVRQNPGLATLLAYLAALTARALFGHTIGPNDIELSSDLNAVLSDPRVVRVLRAMVMTGDDFVDGVVAIPSSLRDSTTDVGLAAVVLLGLGAMGGLFASSPVATAAYGSARPIPPASTVADRAARIPNAVAGDVPQVRIETYSEPGRPDRFEVYIGGTVDFSPVAKHEPFDLTSNLELEAGLPSGAYAGVQQAMALAGIDHDSPVVLTGHSQGGLVASALAASGEYSVDALVTFGAPAGQVAIPSTVPTLIVENVDDIVPALGGTQGNDHALIVRTEAYVARVPDDLALPAHRIEAYLETAEAIDHRAESSEVVAFRERLAALTSGYTEVSAQRYHVTRAS